MLLDEWHGFHPYTTWSTTTFANAERLLAEAGAANSALRLGVVRTYTIRHGPGPLVTEDPVLSAKLPDPHNGHGRWQGAFRVGHFDAVAHRYAIDVCGGVDALAITHADVAETRDDLLACEAYEVDGQRVERLPPGRAGELARQEELTHRLLRARPTYAPVERRAWPATVETLLGARVALVSHGPTHADKQARSPDRLRLWLRGGQQDLPAADQGLEVRSTRAVAAGPAGGARRRSGRPHTSP